MRQGSVTEDYNASPVGNQKDQPAIGGDDTTRYHRRLAIQDRITENLRGTVVPRSFSIDQEKLTQMKKNLIASDLTDIAMEEEQPKELKLMDFKGEAENFNYKPISAKATA